MEVGLGRADVGVSEPERDHGGVDAGLKQRHRAAVSEHVRVYRDPGADYFTGDASRQIKHLLARLEALGQHVMLQEAAA